MAKIIAFIHGKPGAYGISFPDYPGVASGGKTIREAKERGAAGLQAHVEALLDDGVALADLRDCDAILSDPAHAEDLADARAVIEVDVELPSKSQRLTITMDENLLARVDAAARASGESRSGYLAQAARERLAG